MRVTAGVRLLVVSCTQLPRVLRAGLRVHRVQKLRMELADRNWGAREAPHVHACWLRASLLLGVMALQEVLWGRGERGRRRLMAASKAQILIARHEGVEMWSMTVLDFIVARFKLADVARRLVFVWAKRLQRVRRCVRFEVLLLLEKRRGRPKPVSKLNLCSGVSVLRLEQRAANLWRA